MKKTVAGITVGYGATLIGLLWGAYRFVESLHGLVNPASSITPTDIYQFLMLIWLVGYINSMRSFLQEELNALHVAITNEWQKGMKTEVEKITLLLNMQAASMGEIKGGVDKLVGNLVDKAME